MDEGQPRTLKALFQEAEQKRLLLENTYEATSPSYREDLQTAIADYEQCLDQIHKLSLFSPNESLEDVATSDLPYLLVTYHQAELFQKVSSKTPVERRASLERAREGYELFLGLLDSYGLLTPEYTRLYSLYTDDPLAFSTIGGGSEPNTRRNAKIANFKAEKDLKGKLEVLRRDPRYLENGDEEVIRELHLAHIAFCRHMAFQGLEGINRELEVLNQAMLPLLPQATSIQEDERRRHEDRISDGYTERLDPPLKRLRSLFNTGGPILSKEGKPLQPFTLVGTRQDLQNGVFRPGHNLPTMSIDEYLDEERRRGGIIEGGGEASGRRPEPDEDNMEKADEETMAARAWDEFAEANPRGAGNTLNRG
jgi:immunoglobulin-binding protein 1